MQKNSLLLYLGVGLVMTVAIWGLMGGGGNTPQEMRSFEESIQEDRVASSIQEPVVTKGKDFGELGGGAVSPVASKPERKKIAPTPKPQPPLVTPARYVPPGPIVKPVQEIRTQTHKVNKGETLWGISQRYGVTVEKLMAWNKLRGMEIQVGQKLKVKTKVTVMKEIEPPAARPNLQPPPAPAKAENVAVAPKVEKLVPVEAPAPKKEEPKPEPFTGELLTHEIKDGESLGDLVKKYETTKSFLLDVNGLTENSELHVGQILLVPEK